MVAHRPALLELADHVVGGSSPRRLRRRRRSAGRGVRARTEPAGGRPARRSRARRRPVGPRPRLLPARCSAALASASGVALTATAGWLIVQASTRPAVLTLLVAIVAVRTFGLARPVLRYVERLRSHDVALRLLAERRVEVYDALVPLTPGRLGRRRGDLLASIVDDVDSVVDRELRVRMPLRQYPLVAALAPLRGRTSCRRPVCSSPPPWSPQRSGRARPPGGRPRRARAVTARAELSDRVVETTQLAAELVMWQAATGPRTPWRSPRARLAGGATGRPAGRGPRSALALARRRRVAGTAVLARAGRRARGPVRAERGAAGAAAAGPGGGGRSARGRRRAGARTHAAAAARLD